MTGPFDMFRDWLVAPTFQGFVVFVSTLWTAIATGVTNAFLMSLFLVGMFYLLDLILGSTEALSNDKFNKAGATKALRKMILYTCFGICNGLVGLSIDVLVGSKDPVMAYSLMTAANWFLVSIEALSVIEHLDTLSSQKLTPFLGPLKKAVEQIRQNKQAEILAVLKIPAAPPDAGG